MSNLYPSSSWAGSCNLCLDTFSRCHRLSGYFIFPIGEEPVPALSCNVEIPGVQRQTAPFAGVIGVMKCEVAPPLAIVVPEVVVGVLPVDPDR